MAQETPTHYFAQHHPDGSALEPPTSPNHARTSSDSRQELLRLPVQPNPAHLESMDTISPEIPPKQSTSLTKASHSRRLGGHSDPIDEYEQGTPTYYSRPRRQSRDVRTNMQYTPSRSAYVEDYSDEEEDPRMSYQPRRSVNRRRYNRPPAAYENYPEMSARYGPMPGRNSVEGRGTYAYSDHPGKANFEMNYHGYGSEDEYARRRVGNDGRGPPRRPPSVEHVMRLPWAIWMGSNAKNHFVAFIGEFVGTTMFLFFAFSGTQVANIGSTADSDDKTTTGEATGFSPVVLLYIALVFAFSLMVNVWVFFRISGGLFNPAVTFAMLLCKALSPIRAFLLLAAQIAGSIFASFLVSVLFPTQFNVRTTLSSGTSLARGVFIEAVLTAELVFTIFMLAKEKHKATFIAPVGIGLALFIAELVGVYYTGGSLNPARSFGPCVVTGVFDKEHWIYWVGPAAGAIIAVVFYNMIKILEYEVANPGQDDDDKDQEVKEKDGDIEAQMQRRRDGSADV